MDIHPSGKIYLASSTIQNAGRGVFAREYIPKDSLIEKCPVVAVPENQVVHIRKTELVNYYFMWGENPLHHKAAICLGFGSLYNHSYKPNATYKKRIAELYIDFVAIQDIAKNEEITVNYNHGDPTDKTTLWIKSIPPAQ